MREEASSEMEVFFECYTNLLCWALKEKRVSKVVITVGHTSDRCLD